MRTILIEHGYKFEKAEENSQPESWILDEAGKSGYDFRGVQVLLIMDYFPERRVIMFFVKRTIFPNYADEFLNNVKNTFSIKNLEPGYKFEDSETAEQSGYVLIYNRKDSNITVGFEQNDNDEYVFTFSQPK